MVKQTKFKSSKSLTTIIKSTNVCNLACKYCYVEDGAKGSIMSTAISERLLEETSSINGTKITPLIWHGGEPLMAGLDFFENVAYVQYWLTKTKNKKFSNSIQTNGTLVNHEVIDFCLKHNFGLGFSLDGPLLVHGLTRVGKNGHNSFHDAYKGLMLAVESGMSSGAIVVLNKLNLEHVDAIYDFFKENELGLKINPLIRSGNATKNMDVLGITPMEYANAMVHLFDRYFEDNDFQKHLEPFDLIMGNVSTGLSYGCCTFNNNCQENFVSIGTTGDVYPCGRFDGIPEFYMGNINNQPLSDILDGPVRSRLLGRSSETVEGCIDCDYKKICNSGCLNNGYMREGNFMDRDYYCQGYQKLFKHIKERVDKELSKAQIGGK